MKYTKHQLEALNYRGGNLLIIACAGSGKTQVLSRRIALLVSEGTPRDSIVAFTFTDMAAGELKSRIRKEMANLQEDGLLEDASLGDMYVGTIHSFSLQLLKELDASYRNYEIIDEKRQAAIIVSQYENFGLEQLNGKSKIDTIKRFIETLEILYRENINADTLSNPVLVEAIKRYNNFLKSSPNCFLTFNEIIAELTLRLQMDNTLLNQVREKFTNIFVDEYQDVDDRQELLISLLSDTGRAVNICAVGDDDQAIYRFRGATVENILNFSTKYPNVKSIAMTSNFRSTHAVVEIANTAVSGCKIGRKNVPGLARRLPKTMEASGKPNGAGCGNGCHILHRNAHAPQMGGKVVLQTCGGIVAANYYFAEHRRFTSLPGSSHRERGEPGLPGHHPEDDSVHLRGTLVSKCAEVLDGALHLLLNNPLPGAGPDMFHPQEGGPAGGVDTGGHLDRAVGLSAVTDHSRYRPGHISHRIPKLFVTASQQVSNSYGCSR